MRSVAGLATFLAVVLAPSAPAQSSGALIVNHHSPSRLEVYAPDGTLKASTGGGGTTGLWVGATLTPGGQLVTTRRTPVNGINLHDATGAPIGSFDTPEVNFTGDVSAFADGTLAVVDVVQNEVDLYSVAGQHLGAFGAPFLLSPWGNHVDENDVLWVASTQGIVRFDRSGVHLGTIQTGWRAGDVAPLQDGTVWATEQNAARIVRLDLAGNELSSFSTGIPGQHWGLGVMSDGTLRVGAWQQPFVFHFEQDGTLLGQLPIRSGSLIFLTVVGSGPPPISPPIAYCTSKTNSLGCVPVIKASGFPRATKDAGFTVSGTNVRNAKAGLLLYTLSGRTAVPFQGGVLCLAAPVLRTPLASSGGLPPPIQNCGGGWRIDMNAFAAGLAGGKPHAGLRVPGTFVHCQWWGRDPGDPFGSALTDALQYEVAP